MTALVRRAAALLPAEAASPPAWRGHPDEDPGLFEVLGRGRLTTAVTIRDDAAVDRLLDALLDDPYLGRRLAGRVIVRTGQALANTEEGPPPP